MKRLTLQALALLLLLLGANSSRADLIYAINIDTSSLVGDNGYIELSLGGLGDSPLANIVLNSTTTAGLGLVMDQFGNVNGDLSNTLQMASDLGVADLLQQLSFGDVLAMQLRLSGDWLNAVSDAGLTFAIKLWSGDFLPLLTSDEIGDLMRVELIPGGNVQLDVFSEYVSVRPLAIPTPAALPLLALGLLLGVVRTRRSAENR